MKLKISALILIVIVLVFAAVYFFVLRKQKIGAPPTGQTKQETLVEKQSKELDELRQKANGQPLSQKQIKKQLEELDKLRLAR